MTSKEESHGDLYKSRVQGVCSWGHSHAEYGKRVDLFTSDVVRSNYFSLGTRVPAYRAVDNHVYDRMRNFLARRHKVGTRGSRRFSRGVMFGEIGVLQMARVYYGSRSTAL